METGRHSGPALATAKGPASRFGNDVAANAIGSFLGGLALVVVIGLAAIISEHVEVWVLIVITVASLIATVVGFAGVMVTAVSATTRKERIELYIFKGTAAVLLASGLIAGPASLLFALARLALTDR